MGLHNESDPLNAGYAHTDDAISNIMCDTYASFIITPAGYAGIPPDMTGMAELMTKGGYETHAYGKWDAGMATYEQSPEGMGYNRSLFYFWHANDFWTMETDPCTLSGGGSAQPVDLWDGPKPAYNLVNDATCNQNNQTGCTYEDELFTNRVIDAIETRSEKPLFIFWAPHIVHVPLEVLLLGPARPCMTCMAGNASEVNESCARFRRPTMTCSRTWSPPPGSAASTTQ